MRLLIISHTEHYNDNGVIKGWGPTVREISYLAQLFEEVVHLAPLYKEPAPVSALPYGADNIKLHPVPPVGGPGLANKLAILFHIPLYVREILRELHHADVVHVRCPANISLIAIVLLAAVRFPGKRWIKYAGNWHPTDREALSYTFQRWWLKVGLARAEVSVNGKWPKQPAHVYSFLNPCLTETDLRESEQLSQGRQLTQPIRLIFVGQLNSAKGVGRALEILANLAKRHVDATLDLIGDSGERSGFEAQAHELGIENRVTFHGWLPRTGLGAYYSQAHIMLLPTKSSEGWPKVISEAMAYGVVPIAGNVSSIPQYLEQFETGKAISPDDVEGASEAVAWYAHHPANWRTESKNGVDAARQFSYTQYLACVQELLGLKP